MQKANDFRQMMQAALIAQEIQANLYTNSPLTDLETADATARRDYRTLALCLMFSFLISHPTTSVIHINVIRNFLTNNTTWQFLLHHDNYDLSEMTDIYEERLIDAMPTTELSVHFNEQGRDTILCRIIIEEDSLGNKALDNLWGLFK